VFITFFAHAQCVRYEWVADPGGEWIHTLLPGDPAQQTALQVCSDIGPSIILCLPMLWVRKKSLDPFGSGSTTLFFLRLVFSIDDRRPFRKLPIPSHYEFERKS
jgi:hypothetical protein